MPDKVGFIGVGLIGTPMARHVLQAGYSLVIYDVRPSQMDSLVKEGAQAATAPQDVAARCKIILPVLWVKSTRHLCSLRMCCISYSCMLLTSALLTSRVAAVDH